MVDPVKAKLLEHARQVCRAVLGAESSAHVSIYAFVAQAESLPLHISPTNEFMIFIDFTNALELLSAVQRGFASFLGKDVSTQQADRSTWLYWGEGETLSPATVTHDERQTQVGLLQSSESPSSDGISWLKADTILPNWLDRLLFNSLDARYAPDWKKFEYNLDLDADDLRIYLGTYFPRSYAEAFCMLDELFANDVYRARWSTRAQARILDIGCGTGGNLIGFLTALAKHCQQLETIHVVGFDGNAMALNTARRILSSFDQHTPSKIDLTLTTQRITTLNELPAPKHDSYDLITSFKMGCEIISAGRGTCDSFYHELLNTYTHRLSDIGLLILLDVTTKPEHSDFYPQLLNRQVSCYMRDHPGFATIFPIPCHLYESTCRENCFTQKEFSVGHRGARHDLSRVAYRIIGRKAFAAAFHHDIERQAEYVICTRTGYKNFTTCTHSSGRGIQMDGYRTST